MANLFCVRAYYGEYTANFIEGSYVAIGWLPDTNLEKVNSRDEIYSLYKEHYDDTSNYVIGQQVGQIARFLFDIQKGDYVIVPGYDDTIFFGQIAGEGSYYYFEGEDGCPFRHRKKVNWEKEPFYRSEIFQPIQASLLSNLTVFRISEPMFPLAFARNIVNMEKSVEIDHSLDSLTIENDWLNKKDPGGEVTLFYGTTRNLTGDDRVNNYFGDSFEEDGTVLLKYGKCTVNIPPGHKIGEIERPRKILFWSLNETPRKHITVTGIKPLTEMSFYNWLKQSVTETTSKSALIFVHGFDTTFVEAAWRTGQITHDIPFNDGISGFFSWPSTGKSKLDYGRDIERADTSIPAFIKFIEDLIDKTGVKQIHFIAHSMGNRLLTRALNRLVAKRSFKDKVQSISQIVLAAPDIDKDLFNTDILPELRSVGERRTLYASDKDEALKLSKRLRTGLARIGEAGDKIYVADGLDTIDASNVMSEGNHHSYMFETKELLADIYLLLNEGWEPVKRRLKEVRKETLSYWLFPE